MREIQMFVSKRWVNQRDLHIKGQQDHGVSRLLDVNFATAESELFRQSNGLALAILKKLGSLHHHLRSLYF
jgi:hypothetical protein